MSQLRSRQFAVLLGILAALPASAGVGQSLVGGDTSWTIGTGTYTGIRAPIHYEPPPSGRRETPRFLRLVTSSRHERVVGWNPARFPIAVAFRHNRGSAIDARDSAAFWAIINQVEADIGMRLFMPATIAPEDDPVDAIVVTIKASAGADGVTLITWTSGGEVYDARVFLRDRGAFHDSRVVTHEMMHALGFGHTDRWASIMNSPGGRIGRVTAGDVAHVHLAFRSRVSAVASDMWRKLTLGLERAPVRATPSGDECRYGSPLSECGLSTWPEDGMGGIMHLSHKGMSHAHRLHRTAKPSSMKAIPIRPQP